MSVTNSTTRMTVNYSLTIKNYYLSPTAPSDSRAVVTRMDLLGGHVLIATRPHGQT